VKILVKIKGIFIIIFIAFIIVGVLLLDNYAKALGNSVNIEILIDGVDDVPKVGRIGEPIKFEEYIEMWHSSGGYWIYKDIRIYDTSLNRDLLNENTLADAIKGEFKFEYELDSELYEKLIKTEDLKVVCSTTLKNPTTEDQYRN
jgi:hypothetical protein